MRPRSFAHLFEMLLLVAFLAFVWFGAFKLVAAVRPLARAWFGA